MEPRYYMVAALLVGTITTCVALRFARTTSNPPQEAGSILLFTEPKAVPLHARLQHNGCALRTDDVAPGGQVLWSGLMPGSYDVVLEPARTGYRSRTQATVVPPGATTHVLGTLRRGRISLQTARVSFNAIERRVKRLEKRLGR